jgi:hypothetical protein
MRSIVYRLECLWLRIAIAFLLLVCLLAANGERRGHS